jgi:methionyl-tRNA formyltransferase
LSLDLVFMGTPDFSVPILQSLIAAGHRLLAVYSQPPRPAGRGQQPRPSPVAAFAAEQGIEVRSPVSLRSAEEQDSFAALKADAAVVAAYGLILPQAILDAPRFGCLNVHASLLPRWRGAAPIQRAIEAGDSESGVTIMQMDRGLDTGAMLLKEKVAIGESTTGGQLHDQLSALGARLIVEALARLEQGRLTAEPQPQDGVTYAAKLAKDEGRIDWRLPAALLARRLRAFTPWPGLWFDYRGERFKLVAAQAVAGKGAPGEVLDDRLTIACGEGALRLDMLQRAGKAPLAADAFLRGFPLPAGSQFDLPCPATS